MTGEEFQAFGAVELRPLGKVRRLTAAAMSRSWTNIPHVTHHDQLDITDLEAARRTRNAGSEKRLSVLPFVVKAVASTLQLHPEFNSTLNMEDGILVLKKYFHIGIATDTEKGLVVPVVRDCDRKSVAEIAEEIEALASLARSKGLPYANMSGGSFTISSLGALGGTGFTPIVNFPEVAILGVSRVFTAPAEFEGQLKWRVMLPVSLSYDHRVVGGADAGRFMATLAKSLAALAHDEEDGPCG